MRSVSVSYRDATSIPGDAVPALIDEPAPLSDEERVIIARINGLRTIDEIARVVGNADSVRALVVELLWYRSAVIEDVMTIDELDFLEEVDANATPFVLRRRRRNSDSPLVRAIVAHCAQQTTTPRAPGATPRSARAPARAARPAPDADGRDRRRGG
jgi:hypothetical protein